jgi:hypothetical protein
LIRWTNAFVCCLLIEKFSSSSICESSCLPY